MGNKARVGVFLCGCKEVITDTVNFGRIIAEIKKTSFVQYIRESQHLCACLEGELMAAEIKKYRLNRIVVVGCSGPRQEKFFTSILEKVGLNLHFFTMVNLREECSLVHPKSVQATAKALRQVKRGIARLVKMDEVSCEVVKVNRTVLIIGGGIAGIETALEVAAKGLKVIIIEREEFPGGNLTKINSVYGIDSKPSEILKEKLALLKANSDINLMTSTKVIDIDGNIGNFTVYLENEGQEFSVKVGSIVVATGLQTIFCSVKYGLGIADNLLGLAKLEHYLLQGKDFTKKKISFVIGKTGENFNLPFIVALKNALYLKTRFDAEIYVFYSNIKVAGDNWEALYTEARDAGIRFYKFTEKLNITVDNGEVTISYEDPLLAAKIPGNYRIVCDLAILPEEIVPSDGTEELAGMLDIELGPDYFLGPDNVHLFSEYTSREGIYLAGSCQKPSLLPEIMIQAKTVAADIYKKLRTEEVKVEYMQPYVDASKCVVCLTCYRCCPHKAITIAYDRQFNNLYRSAAQVNPLACRRCGICAAECPAKAIHLPGYTDLQILAQLDALEV
ncbi:FAD-dependent pyridine nucleotide-disulfide oxidoreductase [Thermincola ferriacetica]|uniref:FAD-dependent pyridine nucleotide-disulfide oxidoreductase n=1 Tax=Thermincola ferriacetica TaxID=281456 RepID=A0A0L6W7G4_9FIRM|nr:FAD-dependent oxidoreductase [Thermincola ferriacetica]KNZ71044.1 FAD-dependent pyridine nucleotide-disulfide oxidoreductase [Thermincola ferriacetica]